MKQAHETKTGTIVAVLRTPFQRYGRVAFMEEDNCLIHYGKEGRLYEDLRELGIELSGAKVEYKVNRQNIMVSWIFLQ